MTNLKETIKNFGAIKDTFNTILAESVMTKDTDKKKLFKQYIELLKENEILKTQFMVYTNIETKVEPDVAKATQFVKENIDLFSKFSKKAIYEANTKLKSVLPTEELVDDLTELHENIAKLIFTEKNATTIDTIIEATSKVVDYITKNKAKVVNESIELPNSMLTSLMVEKYNERYSTLDETEKKVIKSLIDADDTKKKEIYSTTLRECIDLINEKLDTTDLDTKDKLLRVKDRLLNDKQDITEDFTKNISKLIELRNNLKEN